MNKIILAGFCACFSLISLAQKNTVSSGGDATGSGGSASYSVGQIDYINSTGSNGSVNQGVQQPYEFFKVGLSEASLMNVNLYPNPTNEFIILQLEDFTNDISYTLYDGNGKLVAEGNIEADKTQIDMRNFARGQYHLSIKNATNDIQSIKIIKN